MGTKPLGGIRVLDLTNVLAGPFCCHQLVHFGADVIKVEPPGRGDLARQLGADPELNAKGMGVSFLAQNAGKKSVTLNLKSAAGEDLFKRLVATADVVVENFRPGVMTRLGLDYEVLRAVKPELIYCAISGFGQDTPWSARPAYDQIVQGESGLMSITGDGESGPMRVGYPVADTVGGITAAFAISAALNARPRGAMIDVSMLEALVATMGWAVSNHLIAGQAPEPRGNENWTSAPSGAFETASGLLNIAANKDEQWVILTDHLDLAHLRDDPRFLTREERKANRFELKEALEVVLSTRDAAHWEPALNALGVPAGIVARVPDVLDQPHIRDGGFLATFPDVPGVGRDIQTVTTGAKINGAAPQVDAAPPELGQDNADIWGDLGLSLNEIETLRQEGVL